MDSLVHSSDPRIFGPPTWRCLHILAQNYPVNATARKQKRCKRFLYSLSYLLPCRHCARHFRCFLRQRDVGAAVRGRESLVSLLVGAHNAVAAHTRPDRPPYTVGCATQQYTFMRPEHAPIPALWVSGDCDAATP